MEVINATHLSPRLGTPVLKELSNMRQQLWPKVRNALDVTYFRIKINVILAFDILF